MQINPIGQGPTMALVTSAVTKFRENFDTIGTALQSGDLSAAKDALAQLQSNAPKPSQGSNPLSSKVNALSKAIDSGDIKAAQQAYADLKQAIARHNGPEKGHGGHPPGGPRTGGGKPASSNSGSTASSSETISDPRDTNKDGKVSWAEELAYLQQQRERAEPNGTISPAPSGATSSLSVLA